MKKLLAIASLGRHVYGKRLFHEALPSLIATIALVIIISFMISALLIGSLVAAFFALMQHGLAWPVAFMVTLLAGILITVLLAVQVSKILSSLRTTPLSVLKQSPLTSAIHSFFSGLKD
jgi:uncharacterized membrane protein